MATVPNPKLWVAGQIPTAAEFNSDIRDAFNFYKARPRALASHSADISGITTNTWIVLPWNTTVMESEDIHNPGSNNGQRLTAVTPGRYFVSANVRWRDESSVQNGIRAIMIRKNAAGSVGGGSFVGTDRRHAQTFIAGTVPGGAQGCSAYVYLATNDYVEVFAYHTQDLISPLSDNSEIDNTSTSGARFGILWSSSV